MEGSGPVKSRCVGARVDGRGGCHDKVKNLLNVIEDK